MDLQSLETALDSVVAEAVDQGATYSEMEAALDILNTARNAVEGQLDARLDSKEYKSFSEAMEAWRDLGGCLAYRSGAWIVDYEIEGIGDPRLAAVQAMRAGGMSSKDIAKEMETWTD